MPDIKEIVNPHDRFRQLFQANFRALARYATRRGLSEHDADDLIASIFEVVWRRIDDVPEGDEGILWLYGVAFNQLRNARRSSRRVGRLTSRLSVATPMPAPLDPEDISVETILSAMRSLSEDDREVLLLFIGEGLAAVQVGTVLGCTEATARSRLFRARTRLAGALGLDSAQRGSSVGHVVGVVNINEIVDDGSFDDE